MNQSPPRDGLESFKRHRLAFGDSLVCPVWPMYQAYRAHCAEAGFQHISGREFLGWMAELGVVVRQREVGVRRAVAIGIGVTASEASEARQDASPMSLKAHGS